MAANLKAEVVQGACKNKSSFISKRASVGLNNVHVGVMNNGETRILSSLKQNVVELDSSAASIHSPAIF